jgi:hypothetical protein
MPRICIITAMLAPQLKFGLMIRRSAAFALVLWLAGVGCIIGCEMNVAAAPKHESPTDSQTESCPAFSGHDCCQKTENSDGAASVGILPTNTTNVSCCPLAGLSADPARKINASDMPPNVAQSVMSVAPDTRTSTQLPAYRRQVPDRGSTHLRCCVFLI